MDQNSAWRLEWLTPMHCRVILVLVLAGGFLSHLWYLHHDCPIDLSGDEAQYWDWSRQLDWSYYSKGPLVAWIIRASCAVFGDTMPAVRYPALVLGVGTSVVAYLLTVKLFGSERLGLGTVLLFHAVPMFVAGSVLMTIDPPLFFCWALATYFAATALFDDRRWMWLAAGVAIGIGFLAKYAAMLWFVGVFGFVILGCRGRGLARVVPALLVAAIFAIPVIVWNVQHDWVSFRHVAGQIGADLTWSALPTRLWMIAAQLGAVGPTLAVLMVAAVVYAVHPGFHKDGAHRPQMLLLAWIGLPFLALNVVASLWTKVQLNWPAPAYFTLLILTAYFIATRLRSIGSWKPWRGWFWATVAIGIVVAVVAHDTAVLYPILRPISQMTGRQMRVLDPLARLRGWRELGRVVGDQLKTMPPGTFLIGSDYQQTALLAFYVEGRPKTHCAGAYIGGRLSQYDLWPERRLDSSSPMVGHDAIFLGKGGPLPPEIVNAFEQMERLPELPVVVDGTTVKTFKTWRCSGFRGMTRQRGRVKF